MNTAGPATRHRELLGAWLESRRIQWAVTAVIVVNAVVLGLETMDRAHGTTLGSVLGAIDTICLTVFVVEIGLKLYAFGGRFFTNGWNVFDFVIVAIALVPTSGGLSVLRALRILRVLRLVSVVPRLRFVVESLMRAIPGIASVGGLLVLLFYVGAVMATNLFGETHPQWFGSVGGSAYSLFQIMTLESWSMGIVRPVMEVHPWAWAFFVPFILVSAFAVLNLVMAVMVDSMQSLRHDPAAEEADPATAMADDTHAEVIRLRADVARLEAQLARVADSLETRG